jgi:hypothetical protein
MSKEIWLEERHFPFWNIVIIEVFRRTIIKIFQYFSNDEMWKINTKGLPVFIVGKNDLKFD